MNLGPYRISEEKISYRGNKLFSGIKDIAKEECSVNELENRVKNLRFNPMWGHISKINHTINISIHEFFHENGSLFTLLPLTTRMISSPGAVYGREAINYTTDTSPIKLKWFDLPNDAFLAESSQIYLELALLQRDIRAVYSIYNSFRKERADSTHLSEFHHIEYEGKICQKENLKVISGLLSKLISDLLNKNGEDISYFVDKSHLVKLEELSSRLNINGFNPIKFSEALDALYDVKKDDKYKKFTLQNFGAWEELMLTEIFGDIVCLSEFPLLEVPFYHDEIKGSCPRTADSSDIIWPGYREIIGSGHRIESIEDLEKKAKIFNLPRRDYEPYLQSRQSSNYEVTSGFGLGWERFLQGLLEMPYIWSAVQFPRVDKTLKP